MRTLLPILGLCAFLGSSGLVAAENNSQKNIIGLLAAEEQWLSAATKIAAKLDHENGLRILPIVGAGGVQAFQDLANLPMVDAAIISSDSLIYAAQQELISGQKEKYSYVARLAKLDVVLVAKNKISKLSGLKGMRIATGPAQSASFATGELIFNAMNISFLRVAKQGDSAVDALINGEADAALFLGTDFPVAALSDGRFHVLSLQIPSSLSEIYQPAILTSHELPGLVSGKQSVETFATSLALAIHDHPRDAAHSKALQNFEAVFFRLVDGDGNNNLAAVVPGWKRHAEAQNILSQNQTEDTQNATITPTGGKP